MTSRASSAGSPTRRRPAAAVTAAVSARGGKPDGSPRRSFGGVEIAESAMRFGDHHVKRDGFLVGVLGFGFREQREARLERPADRLAATRTQALPDPTYLEGFHRFRLRAEVVEREIAQLFGLVESAGGLGNAVKAALQSSGAAHLWANTICISGALLGYNMLSVIRRNLGPGGLRRSFMLPVRDSASSHDPAV